MHYITYRLIRRAARTETDEERRGSLERERARLERERERAAEAKKERKWGGTAEGIK